ncbi:valine--tRNA ligase [Nitrospinae bacterium AH_259_B05_G02_I21]|nr:valine--tRNA ligase [Nitrospinae bacterium AH_259_B05_G02_I21]MDA2932399.1 valine--tRNA ligase [Nitrospinae bacterium AH-259-F20]
MSTPPLPKVYDPSPTEAKWYDFWTDQGWFHADVGSDAPPYSIVIPPPNITGSLHMGHALNNTLQDILVRWKRMEGHNVLWMFGTDHAGIATQNVVEQQLAAEGTDRHSLGREAFVERVWAWRDESGEMIVEQLKRLGASCDWGRERFTMDEGLSRAVREVFVRLWEDGLIYRDYYIINWCPRCLTALSDLEVDYHEIAGHLYHIRYPMADGPEHLTIATTRPETMLGDTAVAVHPEDERYRHLIGKSAVLPLAGRPLLIIADEHVDPEFGTGTLKVTPAHDPHDFEIGLRHGLDQVKAMDERAHMDVPGLPYHGQERFAARERIVEDLQAQGLLDKVEDHRHAVGHCYRCQTIVEPTLSLQWFVRMKPLAEPAIEAVKDGRIRIIPKGWEKTYFEWMYNIKDWCISRQIWWGHRIPVWLCASCGNYTVSREDAVEACGECASGDLTQETDVLDTWFSSALWPFSTMGWPDSTDELRLFYPTSVLVTGFDILFFWVARMIMMGLKFMGDVPFHDVYIHALIRDERGEKMSKSKGNVIDPLDMMGRYGTDALRFTLAALAAHGRDIKLSERVIAGYRNFANKLWNATRFVLMHLNDFEPGVPVEEPSELADRWILSRLNHLVITTREALGTYKVNEACQAIYQFVWHEFCDWYLELVKPRLAAGGATRRVAQEHLVRVLDTTVRLLHPFMPYLTEEIWQHLPGTDGPAMLTRFPTASEAAIDPDVEADMAVLIEVVAAIRTVRGEMNLKPRRTVDVSIRPAEESAAALYREHADSITDLARVGTLTVDPEASKPEGAAVSIVDGAEIYIVLAEAVAVAEERKRLEKELNKVRRERTMVETKLAKEDYLTKAPEAIVAKDKGRHAALVEKEARLESSIDALRSGEPEHDPVDS